MIISPFPEKIRFFSIYILEKCDILICGVF